MEHFMRLLFAVMSFGCYFVVSIFFLILFKAIYTRITPYNEWELIKEKKNTAAAIGFVGAILGYCIAVASSAANSVSLIDFSVWSLIALFAQLIAFSLMRYIFMPKIEDRIINNELSAGVMLGGISIAIGLLNAACMTY